MWFTGRAQFLAPTTVMLWLEFRNHGPSDSMAFTSSSPNFDDLDHGGRSDPLGPSGYVDPLLTNAVHSTRNRRSRL